METRPGEIPIRKPKWGFGEMLKDGHGHLGRVHTIYPDYWALLESMSVSEGWFEELEIAPATKDQVFYHCVIGDPEIKPLGGSFLVGEQDAVEPEIEPALNGGG